MLELKDFTLTGNVVHSAWFQTITKANGKADLVTINILAEIVYWYKPTEVRDEQTGAHLGWKNKYKNDLLQKSYVGLADQFGLTERQAKESIKTLEKLGVVERVFRTITVNGTKLHNVLYIKLNIEGLKKVSTVDTEVAKDNKLKRSEKKPRKKQPENTRKASVKTRSFERGKFTKSGIPHYNVPHPTVECGTTHSVMCPTPHCNDTHPTVECGTTHTVMTHPPQYNDTPPTVECDTYTEITTETSTEITTKTSSTSMMDDEDGNKKVVAFFEENFYLIRKFDGEVIAGLCNQFDTTLVVEAMKVAKKNGARALSYIEKILINWGNDGITTVSALDTYNLSKGRGDKHGGNREHTGEESSSAYAGIGFKMSDLQ